MRLRTVGVKKIVQKWPKTAKNRLKMPKNVHFLHIFIIFSRFLSFFAFFGECAENALLNIIMTIFKKTGSLFAVLV